MQFPQDVKHLTCTPYNLWQTKCPCECCHTRHMRFPPEIEHVARCLVLYFCWKSPAWSRNIQNWHWSIEFIKQNLQNCFKVVFFFVISIHLVSLKHCQLRVSKRLTWVFQTVLLGRALEPVARLWIGSCLVALAAAYYDGWSLLYFCEPDTFPWKKWKNW